MTAVILGLVAVVAAVVAVVILGSKSMKRRESNLPPDRLRDMAEGKTKRTSTRPAEDTFFESFPKGFDAFEEPERTLRVPRPSARSTGTRGRRGVDEWGDSDDYDDDYWSRVRADEGGFGGSIIARKAASRPVGSSPSDSPSMPPAQEKADPNAVTVQAALPRTKGLADLVETARATPSSAAADQKTVTFSPPMPPTGARPDAKADKRPDGRGSRSGATASPARQDPLADPLAATGSRPVTGSRPGSGSRPAPRPGSRPAAAPQPSPGSRPPADTRPASPSRRATTGSFDNTTGPFGPGPGGGATTGPLDTGLGGRSGRTDPLGAPSAGTGPFEATGRGGLTADPLGSGRTRPATGTPTGPFQGSRGAGGYDSSAHSPTGPFSSPTSGSFPAPATGPIGGSSTGPAPRSGGTPRGGGAGTEPPWPTSPAYAAPTPSSPAPPAPAPSWNGARDVLDDPEPSPASSSRETWSADDYKLPAYGDNGYSPAPGTSYSAETPYTSGATGATGATRASGSSARQPSPYQVSAGPYEVSSGWATIDESDTTGPSPATSTPTGPARAVSPYQSTGYQVPSAGGNDDVLSGGYYGGYETDRGSAATPATPATPAAWPDQDAGGSWPSYGEMYGSGATGDDDASKGRKGSHRTPDTDYPDYYR